MNCPACSAPLETRRFDDGVSVDFCAACYGVWYDLADLAVKIELSNASAGNRICPRDSQGLEEGLVAGTKVSADRCPSCGGLWLDAGEVQKLRGDLGVDNLVGRSVSDVPPLPRPGASGSGPAQPRERKAEASVQAEPRDSGGGSNPDEALSPRITYQGRLYSHFQSGWPKVMFVLGEFPWRVKVGDEARTRDFIAPPFLLSEEVTGKDRTWTHGVYMEPSEVFSGFGLEGEPPARRGAAPAQPNPHDEAWSTVGTMGTIALTAALVLFIGFFCFAKRSTVFSGTFVADPAVAEKAVVTPIFQLTGNHPASVRVRVKANVSNSWAFFRMALINDETDVALHFEREVSYYWGTDEGEIWSEGSQEDTVYLSRVPPGRYYLVSDPESPAGVGYSLEVAWDEPRVFHLTAAFLLILLPFGWLYARRRSFELARWAESDHPMTSKGDDDEDDE